MKIIDPSFEIITEANPLKRIEIAGRVCYKSEEKITEESAKPFVQGIIKRGHTSVLEHVRVFIPRGLMWQEPKEVHPYGEAGRTNFYSGGYTLNARDFIAHGGSVEQLSMLKNAADYMTVRFICDRAIANELVRHRTCSFSQESTRYVNYGNREIEFIRPIPFDWVKRSDWEPDCEDDPWMAWCESMERSERLYRRMLCLGCTPQEARSVLPLSTKAELIMTATFSHWDEVFKLRLAKAAHPQMRYLMEKLFEEYVKINPNHNCLDF